MMLETVMPKSIAHFMDYININHYFIQKGMLMRMRIMMIIKMMGLMMKMSMMMMITIIMMMMISPGIILMKFFLAIECHGDDDFNFKGFVEKK